MNTHYESSRCYKDVTNKKISGVCSGLAARFNLPVWATRVVMLLLFLQMPFIVAIAYLLAHCCLPSKS
ncbi:PspC domain-containing protein [Pseudoalteromonas mariniglutinosa]|uniref:PspC domain-containing protein n=1 Tax=Pseudoalteromonas mariniglutinosa TaxID=206042 RepID=UPI00384E7183